MYLFKYLLLTPLHSEFGVGSGNQLVECQECHSLYHQECHKPPVTQREMSDPRFVWYCAKCTKERAKKLVSFLEIVSY